MALFDDMLAAIAPEAAVRRALARQRLALLRQYDAAGTPPKWHSWRRPASGPVTASMQQERVAFAARDLLRNNGYAQRALRTLVRASIGSGIVGSPFQGARPASAGVQDLWTRFEDECDFLGHHDIYGLQRQIATAMFADGDVLLRLRPQVQRGAGVPLRLQVLEIDHLDDGKITAWQGAGTGWIDRGIEYDAEGRKVALWIRPIHPGDQSRYLRGRFESERIPTEYIGQVYDMLRPGQDRGVSIFAAAAAPLRDLVEYLDAEVLRKKTESCLTAFVTSEGSDGSPLAPDAGATGADASQVQLAPGSIVNLKPGENVTMATPTGSPDIDTFARQMQLLAAAAGGVMFEHLSGNMEHVNYSSYRVGSFDFAGFIEQIQWLVLRPRMLRPMAAGFIRYGKLAGLISERANLDIRWTPPPAVTSPDPLKDASADEKNLLMGLVSPSELAGRRGWTWAEKLKEIAADRALADEAGMMFAGDPRRPETAVAAPAPPAASQE